MNESEARTTRKGQIEEALSKRVSRNEFLGSAAKAGIGGIVALALWNSINAEQAQGQTAPANSVFLLDKNSDYINPASEDTLKLIKTNTDSLLKTSDLTFTKELGRVALILAAGGAVIDPRDRNWTITETVPVSGSLGRTWTITEVVPISHANLDVALSTLAKESGGNLATLTGKDFATQATLALIKAKTDNLDAALSTLATATGQSTTQPRNLTQIGGTLLTGRDWSVDFSKLDVALSTVAKESGGNLATLTGKDFATQATLALIKAKTDNLDAALSTLATATGQSATQPRNLSQYLGSAVGLSNPVHDQIVYGGAVIDPRAIRTLTSSDQVDVTPTSPVATDYLPVRLTDGSAFYNASGGGGAAADAAGFSAYFDDIAPAANKYMATIFNTSSTRKVVVRRLDLIYRQTAAVTGVVLDQQVRRITARTAGTTVTPTAADSNDTLSSGITADTGSTSVTDGALLQEHITSSEELLPADELATGFLLSKRLYEKPDGMKGLTLRQNQGVSVKNITSSTVGAMSYLLNFSDEAA